MLPGRIAGEPARTPSVKGNSLPRIIPDLLTAEDFPVQFGRYTLLGVVGEGGMARVYRAELRGPSGFTKPVALKVIRAAVASRGERLRRSLINEARVGGLLNHPNVVEVNDFGEVDGLPYIAMPLVKGVGMERLLAVVRPLPPGIALKIGMQIAAGLEHAHNIQAEDGAELVHRDLKPSNVMISRHGAARVLDFGIAKATSLSTDATDTGQTKGTPAYMSPEQVAGESLDRRSDIFAVGALLYEMVTGDRMFGAASMVATLQQIVGVESHLLTAGKLEKMEAVLSGIAPVVHRCLRLDPDLRYSDTVELEHDLGALLDTVPATPPLRVWIQGIIEDNDLARGTFDMTESLTADSRVPLVGQVQWKAAGTGGVGPTRIQMQTPSASDVPEPAAMGGAALVRPAPEPQAPVEPAPPPAASQDVQPKSEAELQDSFFETKAVEQEVAKVAAVVPETRVIEAVHTPPAPPPKRTGDTAPYTPVKHFQRSMLPVLVFALGLGLAITGGAVVAGRWVNAGPSPSEVALAEVSAQETERRALQASVAPPPEPATPQPVVEPVPEATPEPVAAAVTKKRTTKKRSARKPKRTSKRRPPQEIKPKAEAAPPSVGMSAGARVEDRTGSAVTVTFAANATGDLDALPVLHYRKPGGGWKQRALKAAGNDAWHLTIRFTKVKSGAIQYYVEGSHGGQAVRTATRGAPKSLAIK